MPLQSSGQWWWMWKATCIVTPRCRGLPGPLSSFFRQDPYSVESADSMPAKRWADAVSSSGKSRLLFIISLHIRLFVAIFSSPFRLVCSARACRLVGGSKTDENCDVADNLINKKMMRDKTARFCKNKRKQLPIESNKKNLLQTQFRLRSGRRTKKTEPSLQNRVAKVGLRSSPSRKRNKNTYLREREREPSKTP